MIKSCKEPIFPLNLFELKSGPVKCKNHLWPKVKIDCFCTQDSECQNVWNFMWLLNDVIQKIWRDMEQYPKHNS